jgi:hypothetical protein
MKRNASLKKILSLTRPHWEGDEARPAVRNALRNVLFCGTPALGAEVYAVDVGLCRSLSGSQLLRNRISNEP